MMCSWGFKIGREETAAAATTTTTTTMSVTTSFNCSFGDDNFFGSALITIEERFSMVDDLNVFLGILKLEKYCSLLAGQDIDVDTLKSMSKEELMSAKLPLGAALKILKSAKEENNIV